MRYKRKFKKDDGESLWIYPVKLNSDKEILRQIGYVYTLLERNLISEQKAKMMLELLHLAANVWESSTIVNKSKRIKS